MEYGIVYLLTNPVMPGLVKIGMTTQEDIEKRMKELYTTGVPVPFECQFACKVKKGDCAKIEKALHMAFAPTSVPTPLVHLPRYTKPCASFRRKTLHASLTARCR